VAVKGRSISSSRQPGFLTLGCILLALSGTVLLRPAWATPLEGQLDQLLRGAEPGVVRIDVRRAWSDERPSTDHNLPRRALATRRIQGSGLVWDRDGHIVTGADLAQPGDTIRVSTADGMERPGEFVSQDPDLGISVIHVHGLPSLRPIPRSPLFPEQSSWVMTLGFPGVVRPNRATARLSLARTDRVFKVQGGARGVLDADGDPALAGGGVLDCDGRLLGILLGEGSESLLLDAGRRGSRIEYPIRVPGPSLSGWVLPVAELERSVPVLLDSGRIPQGFLGVRVDLPPGESGASGGPGVQITSVLQGSPADLAGLRQGDRLVGFDGTPVVSWDELTQRVAAVPPGRDVRVDAIREGREQMLTVRIADRGHMIWRQRQRQMANNREKSLRHQIEGLRQQLELLRHQLLSAY
jgi:S1-C subfamily serine protease